VGRHSSGESEEPGVVLAGPLVRVLIGAAGQRRPGSLKARWPSEPMPRTAGRYRRRPRSAPRSASPTSASPRDWGPGPLTWPGPMSGRGQLAGDGRPVALLMPRGLGRRFRRRLKRRHRGVAGRAGAKAGRSPSAARRGVDPRPPPEARNGLRRRPPHVVLTSRYVACADRTRTSQSLPGDHRPRADRRLDIGPGQVNGPDPSPAAAGRRGSATRR